MGRDGGRRSSKGELVEQTQDIHPIMGVRFDVAERHERAKTGAPAHGDTAHKRGVAVLQRNNERVDIKRAHDIKLFEADSNRRRADGGPDNQTHAAHLVSCVDIGARVRCKQLHDLCVS